MELQFPVQFRNVFENPGIQPFLLGPVGTFPLTRGQGKFGKPCFSHLPFHRRGDDQGRDSDAEFRKADRGPFCCKHVVAGSDEPYPSAYRLALYPAQDGFTTAPHGVDHAGKAAKEFFSFFQAANSQEFVQGSPGAKSTIPFRTQHDYRYKGIS